MSWRALLEDAYSQRGHATRPRFEPAASVEALARVERGLGCRFPAELRELLLEANGIMELIEIDGGWIESGWLIWPLDEVRDRNIELRRERGEARVPVGALAFSGAGVDGILFTFDLGSHSSEVLAWNPRAAEHEVKAASLHDFLPGWIAGKISV